MKKKSGGTEKIYRAGLADPRGAAERAAGLINRALSGQRKAPGRAYDDSPSQMAKAKGKKR